MLADMLFEECKEVPFYVKVEKNYFVACSINEL